MRKLLLLVLLMVLRYDFALGQDVNPMVEGSDSKYFDFWPGTWFKLEDGQIDTTGLISKSSGPSIQQLLRKSGD